MISNWWTRSTSAFSLKCCGRSWGSSASYRGRSPWERERSSTADSQSRRDNCTIGRPYFHSRDWQRWGRVAYRLGIRPALGNWSSEPWIKGILHLRVRRSSIRLILLNDNGRFRDVLLRLWSVLMKRRILHVWVLVDHLRDWLSDRDGGLVIRQFCLRLIPEVLVISFLHLKFEG